MAEDRLFNANRKVAYPHRKLTNFLKMNSIIQNTVKTAFSEFLTTHTKKPGVKMIEKLRKLSYDAWLVRKLNVPD